MGRQQRISLEEALQRLASAVKPLAALCLPLDAALGRILAEPVVAQMDQPPFARSPYDGYALIAADSQGASRQTPVRLKVVGKSIAGSPADVSLERGQAVRIMTGGLIPAGADCVIMQEQTDCGEQTVELYQELKARANYCERGEDFKTGDVLVTAGLALGAAEYAVLTSAGCETVKVFPAPRVAVFSTGKELERVGQPLKPGQIYDSNSAFMRARLQELRLPLVTAARLDDELDELTRAFAEACQQADLVISTGGVSVGEKDLVPEALKRLGAEIVFHGVDIKPGMPAACAVLNGVPVLALSGNPFAAAVTFELLARPALARLASDKRLTPRTEQARLAAGFEKARPNRRFQRGILNDGAVAIPAAQGNGQMLTMVGCNCLVELPAGDALPAGSSVTVHLL
ncbi:MAG: Molybdopterin molybdenumtransferase [Deltaproteobacteria bacterium ADurb.Bin510]|nr:MAG: Molybdopterin molybdenumtransferase [Deltaproteobacteria bacterium ADurb.Bin510]